MGVMPIQQWLAVQNMSAASTGVAGTTLSTAATLAISPSSASAPDYVLPGGTLVPGMIIKFTASGIWTCGATATNATFALKWNGTGGTTLATTGPLAMLTAQTNISWYLEALLTCRSVGSSGTLWTQGKVTGITAAAPVSVSRMDSSVFGTPAVATVDTTANSALVLNGTLSQVTNAPTITCEQWSIEW